MSRTSWEDRVNEHFISEVGVLLARYDADRLSAVETLTELTDLYEVTIDNLPELGTEGEED